MQPGHELSSEAFLAAIAAGDVKVLRSCKEHWLELGLVAGMVKAAECGKLAVIELFLRQSNQAQRLVIDNAEELIPILAEYGNKTDQQVVRNYLQKDQGLQLIQRLSAVFNAAASSGYEEALDFFLTNYQAVLASTNIVNSAFEAAIQQRHTSVVDWFMTKFGADPERARLDLPNLLPKLLECGYATTYAKQLGLFILKHGDVAHLDPNYALAVMLAKIDLYITRWYRRRYEDYVYDHESLKVALLCNPKFPLVQREQLLRRLIGENSNDREDICKIFKAVLNNHNTQVEILELLLLDEEFNQKLSEVIRCGRFKVKSIINHPNMPPGHMQNLAMHLIQPATDGSFAQVKVPHALLCAIASDRQTVPNILRALTVSGPYGLLDNAQIDTVVLAAVAGNTSTPVDVLQRLVKSQEDGVLEHKLVDRTVLAALAGNTSTPPDVLKSLVTLSPSGIGDHEKVDVSVLLALVNNAKPDIAALKQLLRLDERGKFVNRKVNAEILTAIVENPEMPADILRLFVVPAPEGICDHRMVSDRLSDLKHLAEHANASIDIFQRLVAPPPDGVFTPETEKDILRGLVANPRTPSNILQRFFEPGPASFYDNKIVNEGALCDIASHTDAPLEIWQMWQRLVTQFPDGNFPGYHSMLVGLVNNPRAPIEIVHQLITPPPEGSFNARIMGDKWLLRQLVNHHPLIVSDWKRFVLPVQDGGIADISDDDRKNEFLLRFASNEQAPLEMLQYCLSLINDVVVRMSAPGGLVSNNEICYAVRLLAQVIGNPNTPTQLLQPNITLLTELAPKIVFRWGESAEIWYQQIGSDCLSAMVAAEARLTIPQKQQMLRLVFDWIEPALEKFRQASKEESFILEDHMFICTNCKGFLSELRQALDGITIDNVVNSLLCDHPAVGDIQGCNFFFTEQQQQALNQAAGDKKSLLRAAFLAKYLATKAESRKSGVSLNLWRQIGDQLGQYQHNLSLQLNLQLHSWMTRRRQIEYKTQQVEQVAGQISNNTLETGGQ